MSTPPCRRRSTRWPRAGWTTTQLAILDGVCRDLPTRTRALVEEEAVTAATRQTAAQLRTHLQAEAQRLDPEHAARAARRGVAQRDAQLRPSPLDGCQRLVADLPRPVAAAAWDAVNGAARAARAARVRADGTVEDRTLPQLRADVLAALLTGQTDWEHFPLVGRTGWWVPTPQDLARLAEVQVVVAADTLLGESDLPGHIPGVGPVDPDTIRDLASRSRWRRLVVDPSTGTLLHADTITHPPTSAADAPDSGDDDQPPDYPDGGGPGGGGGGGPGGGGGGGPGGGAQAEPQGRTGVERPRPRTNLHVGLMALAGRGC